jgi:hypothetical protein
MLFANPVRWTDLHKWPWMVDLGWLALLGFGCLE